MKIVIIGNGVAGVTAARHIRKLSDNEITIISSETDHFFSRTALMYIYMGHLTYEQTKPYEDFFWKKNKIDLVKGYVNKIDFDSKKLELTNSSSYKYDVLIIATGSKSNKFGWSGQDLDGVQGLYNINDLHLLENNTVGINHSVVVGGGLIGIELVEMLHSRHIPVTFIVRENSYMSNLLPKEEGSLIYRHILDHKIDIRMETELDEILPDENGKVRGVTLKNGEFIECQFVGLTVGVSPNINFLIDSGIKINRGILVNEYLETNIKDVYALGDCAELDFHRDHLPKIEQLWYTSKMQGETVAKTICGNRTIYNRGILFNSAKFLDIEWHTYGLVLNSLRETENSLYWENKKGDKCFRINFWEHSKVVTGMNCFGIRHRHKIWEDWLHKNYTIEKILSELKSANFDPEFFKSFESEIVKLYNHNNTNSKIELKKVGSIFSRILK